MEIANQTVCQGCSSSLVFLYVSSASGPLVILVLKSCKAAFVNVPEFEVHRNPPNPRVESTLAGDPRDLIRPMVSCKFAL